MKKSKAKIIVIIVVLVVLLAACVIPMVISSKKSEGKVVIATEDYTEEYIWGYLFKDLVEEYTDCQVELKEGLGGTEVCFQALKSGQIDVYLEYTGTAYGATLALPYDATADMYQIVKDTMEEKYGLTCLETTGFNNTYCLAISEEMSKQYNITKISDLINCEKKFRFSPTFEFEEREDGMKKLQKDYKGLEFSQVIPLEDTLKYTSLESGETDIVLAFSTDGLLQKYNLVILEDDLNSMYPYEAFPFVRMDTLKKYPDLEEALNKLSGKVDDKKMSYLNYQVDVEQKKPGDVAHDYLVEEGLISK
ncbi:MAG: glycine betaine ABC transporter substrate-binding protein [Eubacterium sp.]